MGDLNRKILVLGGAGFIGSNIVARFVEDGYNVTVIDGLLANTFGSRANLGKLLTKIAFIESKIEDVAEIRSLIQANGLIIDSIAWTSHHAAIRNPLYDLDLNCRSHLHVINNIRRNDNKTVIYLGSRGQYGNPRCDLITEETPMIPEDVQGIHKCAAESYYRVYSKIHEFNALSLRVPNCFGRNQPVVGEDIGLVGSFIRDALLDKEIVVYGSDRKRPLVYVKDLAETVFALRRIPVKGFDAYNVCGFEIPILELAETIVGIIGRGKLIVKTIPKEIKDIDIGTAAFDCSKLERTDSGVRRTDFKLAITETINYFKEHIT